MIVTKELKVGESFPVNEKLAGLVPMACKAEQLALSLSIMENGLEDPVVLWRGEVVDGRCRSIACMSVGVPIRGRDLDDELTEDQVAAYVETVNTRRNLTLGQKIMIASKAHGKPGSKSLSSIAESWGISSRILVMANYVSKHRPEFVDPLFNGETVSITDKNGAFVDTNKISAIHASIRREEERVVVKTSNYGWQVEDYIKTQRGLDYFYSTIIGEKGIKDPEVLKLIALGIETVYRSKS
jgi:hypothetical protein